MECLSVDKNKRKGGALVIRDQVRDYDVASPALLCHKESVRAFKAPLLAGSLWHRVVGFPARKGSIIGRPCAIKNYRSARNGGIS